jgi:hypothetical protein
MSPRSKNSTQDNVVTARPTSSGHLAYVNPILLLELL